MLTPHEVSALQETALLLTQDIHVFLLEDIARRVAKAGSITSTAEYQLYRAQFLGADMPKLKKDLAQRAEKMSPGLDALFSFVESKSVDFTENPQLQQIAAAYLKSTKKDLATLLKTKNIGFAAENGHVYPLQNAYLEVMDYAARQVITGAADYNTVIRRATKRLADGGIRTIPQKNGRSVGIEYATRRYVMNNISAVATNINVANHDAIGANGWEISAHFASAPDHEPYQGRQFTDKAYAELNDFTLQRRIGTLSCKHIAYPIVLGVSPPAYSEEQLRRYASENAAGITYQGRHYTLYEAGQFQKNVENEIRRQKNRCLVADALGDKEGLRSAQIRLNVLKDEYGCFSRTAGLCTSAARMQVPGFGHSAAGKAVWADRKRGGLNSYSERSFGAKPITKESINAVPKVYADGFGEEQALNLQNAHRALLKAVQNMEIGTEAGVYLDKDMRPIGDYVLGKIGSVKMPHSTAEVKAMLHNHASGETFSLEDISRFTTDVNLDILTAVGNDGNVYILEKMGDYNFSKMYRMLQSSPIATPTSVEDLPQYISKMEVFLDGLSEAGVSFRNVRAK